MDVHILISYARCTKRLYRRKNFTQMAKMKKSVNCTEDCNFLQSIFI